jgi:hypothetical protein
VRDHRAEGDALWKRFTNETAQEQLWYHSELLAFFEQRRPGPLVEDLAHAVSELEQLMADDPKQPRPPSKSKRRKRVMA